MKFRKPCVEKIQTTSHQNVSYYSELDGEPEFILATHSTTLGPAVGPCRIYNYASEDDAIEDALRLSKAMTYKAALAGLPCGGGAAVIIADPQKAKSKEFLEAFGRCVQEYDGQLVIISDTSAVTYDDIATIRTQTPWIFGGNAASKTHSEMTALGVIAGMRAAAKFAGLNENLKNVTVAIQGLGKVGYKLAKLLAEAGGKLIVTAAHLETINKVAKEFDAAAVSASEIYDVECDIFAPCALGGVLNKETIPRLNCKIVAGAANNQLTNNLMGYGLQQQGIIYVPDYAVNAGGFINAFSSVNGYNEQQVVAQVQNIYNTIGDILKFSRNRAVPPHAIADGFVKFMLAEETTAREAPQYHC